MARQKQRTPATIYAATIRSSLEHFNDPGWLGRHSPLASPYFLGEQHGPGGRTATPDERGLVLQKAIRRAADSMWGGPLPAGRVELAAAADEQRATLGSKSPRYRFYLLELRYLRRYYPPSTFPTSAEAMPGFVNVSQTRFFIHLEEAIDELGRHINDQLNPALRLERPSLARRPIGREPSLAAIEADLQAGRSVAVTGQGGVGKTTAGAAIIARWPGVVFWHTFRPGLNDDLPGLLFSLGHFAREAGAPMLWAQLLANIGGVASPAQALGMLRMDLESISPQRPLLVFDEVDLLQTATGDPRRKQHAQALELLESLHGAVPLLLLGQRVYVDTDAHYALEPLPPAESGVLLSALGLDADAATLHHVHQFTGGNPRLLELFAALARSDDEAADLLRLPRDASARPLFHRLWRRLDPVEHQVLGALSVFRTYAPRDAWRKHDAIMADLIRRNLVKVDLAGGVALLPFFRELVHEAIPAAQRQTYHLNAAHIRSQFGDYTAAAYHYVTGGKPEAAVEAWFVHQDQEILAGQAGAAVEIFDAIEPARIDEPYRGRLLVISNRLALLQGEVQRVLAGMESFTWEADDEVTAEALGQQAYAYRLREQDDVALVRYDEAINMLLRLATKITGWHRARGIVLSNGADFTGAENEVRLAMLDIETLQGSIAYLGSQFGAARTHFQSSLRMAKEAGERNRVAHLHHWLSMVAGRQADMPTAREHAEKAMAHYSEVGNRLQQEGMRAELAGMYLNVRQFEEVIEPSEKALEYFERIKHEIWVSKISTNLAEAYLETNELVKAKEMVFKALRMEDPGSRPYALYTLGHIHDREGNYAHADTSFREGIETARAQSDPFIEAYLRRSLGEMLARDGDAAAGAEYLAAALKLFTEMGLDNEVARTQEAIAAAQTGVQPA